MATLVLQAAGAYLGGFFGPVGSAIGAAAGSMAGYYIDRGLIESTKHYEGARLAAMHPFTAEEGAPVARIYGTMRTGGTLIWATRFEEVRQTKRQGFKGGPRVTSYSYFGNAAFALCEGQIAGIRRVWADGRELDLTQLDMRVYQGTADQPVDPLIEARQGEAPAYRGIAYVVFEHLPLEPFGNRMPQMQFEVLKPAGPLNPAIEAVCLIPGSTEWGLAPFAVTQTPREGETLSQNRHMLHAGSDFSAALDELQALCPNLEHVAVVAAWFGNDLRAGECQIRPCRAQAEIVQSSHQWQVSGIAQADAAVVSQSDGKPAFGGTPADESLIAALADIAARGLKATLYPFVMMDIPAGNTRPSPYGGNTQPPYPWRGRITAMPGPEMAATADKTAAARAQVAAFCGTAQPGQFASAGGGVSFTGAANDFGYRRMILHYAHLAAQAGGVDAFLIGSELRGLTALSDQNGAFPFVEALMTLAAEVRAIIGPVAKITYGADWSEYFGHQPGDGDAIFHLDPLWAHPAINAIGIDNYMPLSDWRDEDFDLGNPDGMRGPDDALAMSRAIGSGEGFDWYYANAADREARQRTAITDGAYSKPWVYRFKDLHSWWSEPHHNRVGGIEAAAPTAWTPRSKPFWFTELGCPAVDKGANLPSSFPDPKSSENALPHFSSGGRSDLAQARFLKAHMSRWRPDAPGFQAEHNPLAPGGAFRMVDPSRLYLWAWDARPFPAFPQHAAIWGDHGNWQTGHWLNGRLSALDVGDLINSILADHGLPLAETANADGALQGYVIDSPGSARQALEPLIGLFGLSVRDDGGPLKFATGGADGHQEIERAGLAVERGSPELQRIRTPDHELPAELNVAFRDPGFDYQAASARAVETERRGRRQEALAIPAAFDAGAAGGLAEAAIKRIWDGRSEIRLALPASERRIFPGQTLSIAGEAGRWLVMQIEEGVTRRIIARSHRRRGNSTVRSVLPQTTPPLLESAPAVEFMDLPSGESGSGDRFVVAASAFPWRPVAVLASPSAEGFALRARLDSPAAMGRLASALPPGAPGRVSRAADLLVRFSDAEPASVAMIQMLNGANLAAVASLAGGHEVLQYQDAEEVSPCLWRLSGLLRGQAGTSDQSAMGAADGARIVLLDDAVQPAGLAEGEAGLTLNWKAGPANIEPGPLFVNMAKSGGMRALMPLAPVHLKSRRSADGSLELAWIRCGRLAADTWDGPDIPLGEEREDYEVSLHDAAGTVRAQAEAAVQQWTFTAAQIAALGAGEFTAEVRQISARTGPGLPARLSVTLP